jgi:hypothetical protein
MATTTPNYGWTVPTSTDLVKDGATAIETLGDAIDASMNTALGTKKAGMVLLNTTSFSAVASQSVNDVFSATYENYLILLNVPTATIADSILMRLRVSGSDNSSSNYYWSLIYQNFSGATTPQGANSNGLTTAFRVGYSSSTTRASIQLFSPFATSQTSFNADAGNHNSDFALSGGNTSVTTSYTGFTIIASSGTLTGTVSVYGYNK